MQMWYLTQSIQLLKLEIRYGNEKLFSLANFECIFICNVYLAMQLVFDISTSKNTSNVLESSKTYLKLRNDSHK